METALDRLLRESGEDNDNPRYTLEEQMEDDENEPSFLDAMSSQATDLLQAKLHQFEDKSVNDKLEDILNEDNPLTDEVIEEELVEDNGTKDEEVEEKVEDHQEEPKEEFKHIEKVTLDQHQPVVEQKKNTSSRGRKKMAKKDINASKADELMSNLANECIDIMIQSGVTIHNFSEEQMQIIWAYIREKLNASKN